MFVAGLVVAAVLAPWSRLAAAALAGVLSLYVLAIALVVASAVRRHGLRTALGLCLVFPAMHFGYGAGYLRGILDFMIRRNRRTIDSASVPISR
jgi:hypothetical protein